ncbi:hypothetical protein C5S36_04555 [Candidatus Methanophagaceae archaeon]|nr:hypothetical protein C5S36_04555 [Methanophagales archaeon]
MKVISRNIKESIEKDLEQISVDFEMGCFEIGSRVIIPAKEGTCLGTF